ncbi:uncharacterized protein LOC124387162 isoform X2 [Silurus meridionalis]|uniref:uncharacterized protein LOC124387162 isoform X2 n=1 Tax=Silurus meridionalis TaxID=175797 RepID=UPI001EECAFD7|nr:uncharacterized protein LOC124387162 isoform X2 [Silurus meridionalis]
MMERGEGKNSEETGFKSFYRMLCILHLLTWAVMMGSCSQLCCIIPHCVHFLLILTCSTVPALAPFTIKAKLHQSVDLICKQECPGTLKWVTDNQPDDVLAQCDQTSCRSKEGYIISHEEYKTGSLSLTVMEADYTERSSVELKPGEDLVLDLPIPEPVEVIYNSSDLFGPQYEQICTVVGGSLQCKDEYRGEYHSVIQPSC